jgi:hypothetical protein
MEDEFSNRKNRKTETMKSNFHYFVTNDGMKAFNEVSKEEKEQLSKDSQDFVNEFKRCLFQEYNVLPHTLYDCDVLEIVKGKGNEVRCTMENETMATLPNSYLNKLFKIENFVEVLIEQERISQEELDQFLKGSV